MANQAWSFVKTSALAWADDVAGNSLWNILPFLLTVWKLNFSHAETIVSVMSGCIKMMPMPTLFLLDTFSGDHYGMLSISSVCLSIGWSFLAISTSSMFLKLPLSSCENGPFCVGEFQWVLLYASLALITLGITGHSISLQEFTKQQLSGIEDTEQLVRDDPQLLGAGFMIIFVRFFCAFVVPFIWPWEARFAIPAICVVAATFLFFRGSGGYIRVERPKSPILRVVRVVVASCLKVRVHVPKDPRELYEKNENGNEALPHTNRLRFLDKAATLSRSQTIEEQENQEWRLCRLTEVEETKIFFLMIPMWMSFIVLGLVFSVGLFYFVAQAFNKNPRFMFITIHFLIFLREYSKSISTNIFVFLANKANVFGLLKQKHIPAAGMAVGMFISILCIIVAALVESMRLSRGLVSTTVFWLIPQFILLGTMNGILDHSTLLFAVTQAPDSMKSSMGLINEGVYGVGYIVGSVLPVYITGRVSAERGSQSWFGESINKSRLDKYYWALAALSSVNLVYYGLVAYWFDYKEVSSTREPQEEVDEELLHHHDE